MYVYARCYKATRLALVDSLVSLSLCLAIGPPDLVPLSSLSASSTDPFFTLRPFALAAAGGRFINLASLNLFLRLVRCRLRSQVFTSHSNGTRDPRRSDNEKERARGFKEWRLFKEDRANEKSMI